MCESGFGTVAFLGIFVCGYTKKKNGEHLSMKEGSLFCFVLMRSTKPGCFRSHSWFLWKALEEEGAWAWFHGVWTCGVEVLEY